MRRRFDRAQRGLRGWLALLVFALVLPLGTFTHAVVAAAPVTGTGISWGDNSSGQLGDNDGGNDSATPVPVVGVASSGGQLITITAGGFHSLAIATDGTVWAWGENGSGQIGNNDGTGTDLDVPQAALPEWAPETTVTAVSAGGEHSLALTADGAVWSWGDNSSGQLGDSDGGNDSILPVPVASSTAGGRQFAAVAAGGRHSLGLTTTGAVFAWGENGSGQLGNNDGTNTDLDVVSAQLNFGGAVIVAIAAGGEHSLALAADGTVYAWGESDEWQTGNNDTVDVIAPSVVPGTGPGNIVVTAIAAGGDHSLALTADGTVYAWGRNDNGQLGLGTSGADSPLISVVPGTGPGNIVVTAVSAGREHSLALTADGTVYAWGLNNNLQLGDGTADPRNVPTQVSGSGPLGAPYFAVAAGGAHSLGLVTRPTAPSAIAGTATFGGGDVTMSATFVVSGTGGPVPAGGAVTFTYNGTDYPATTDALGVATATAPLAVGTAAGTYPGAVQANYAGAPGYDPSGDSGTLTVDKAAQTIDFPLPPDATYGDAPFAVTATATSSLAVALAASGECSIAGATVTLTGAGECTIVASQAGDDNYLPADPVSRTFAIAQAAQTIAFAQPAPVAHGDPPLVVAATATSGLPVTFTAGPATVCTATGANGSTITLVGPGDCTVVAHQAGDANHLPAPDVARIVGVAPCDTDLTDVAVGDQACAAIAALVQAGVIKGYATDPPTFGPDDDVQRAQLAAFLVRALGWESRPTGPRTFTDFGELVAELRTASLIAANACDGAGNCVARGYGDGRFGPTDPVSHAQVITFIARAFALDPATAWAPGAPAPGTPAQHAGDIGTYLANAGAIPDAPTTAAGWDAPASRAWVAMVLWQALQATP